MPPGERNKRRQISPSLKEAAPGRSPPVRRDNKDKHVREVEDPERESPATVDTITESESCSEAA